MSDQRHDNSDNGISLLLAWVIVLTFALAWTWKRLDGLQARLDSAELQLENAARKNQ